MSSVAHQAEGHSHHLLSLKTLLLVAGALAVLTILTVVVRYIHFPEPWNIIVAMGIAIVKATLVVLFFMNLYYDNKFNLIVFLSSILFFVIMVGITLLDTLFREPVIPAF